MDVLIFIKTVERQCLILIPKEGIERSLQSMYTNSLFLKKSPLAFTAGEEVLYWQDHIKFPCASRVLSETGQVKDQK